MTREKAKKILRSWDGVYIGYSSDEVEEAHNMAISALEQNEKAEEWYKLFVEKLESCDDAISREAVIGWLKDKDIIKLKSQEENARKELMSLPSVTQKSGKWIAQDIHNCHTDFRCSECGYIHSFMHLYGEPTADYTYCPNCGAKMESEEQK